MTPADPAVITYDGLPIASGGAHWLRTTSPVAAWDGVRAFLTTFTTYSEPERAGVSLVAGAFSSPPLSPPAGRRRHVKRVLEHAIEHWDLQPHEVDGTLEALERRLPLPRIEHLDACSISVAARFDLIDPGTGAVLPGQGRDLFFGQEVDHGRFLGESFLNATLGERSAASVFFSFPFDPADPAFAAYLRPFSAALPFKMSPHAWRVWRRAKTRNRYIGRKWRPA